MSFEKDMSPGPVPEFLSGGGEMGERIRNFDWTHTSLGPVDSWPKSLRTCVRIMLSSRQPIWIGWGKDLIKLYNDPYIAIVGGKHPDALGEPASVVWKAIWKEIGPMLSQVMDKDEGTYVESQLLIMERNGYPEETYFTFSYTPIPGDDGQTGGMICANTDDTERIISERQLKSLTELASGLADAKTEEAVYTCVQDTLSKNLYDFPFLVLYRFTEQERLEKIKHRGGGLLPVFPDRIDLASGNELSAILSKATRDRQPAIFDRLRERIGPMPAGAWQVSSDKALVLPIAQMGTNDCYGFFIVGLSPFHLLDEKYHQFFTLTVDQVATSLITVNRLEEERKRLEELAALDRAKTVFFSNISHEFRTPLTLILGPIRDTLEDPEATSQTRLRMEVAHRNGLRLFKLVNNLLDFSRIEAGRMQAAFEPIDLASLTRDLTSSFRSATEKAGIALEVDCASPEPVYADLEMWEKIVLNLLSNAFKYTLEGKISVTLSQSDGFTTLAVGDTGVGIPIEEQDRIFERFHRVQNTRSRSQEGTGIGLSLVSELVKLHGGTIAVHSQIGAGSVFTVKIPLGTSHLPPELVNEKTLGSYQLSKIDSYLGEVSKWSGEGAHPMGTQSAASTPGNSDRPLILLADDNNDMRGYVRRLLESHYQLIEASDGEQAFQLARERRPQLILTDVMMPVLDGFGLINRIRGDKSVQLTPVIFLSARAGEEARVEGLQAGADDYLVKPFSTRELLAKIEGNLKITRNRSESENNLRRLIQQAPVAIAIFRGPDHILEMANEKTYEIWQKFPKDVENLPLAKILPELSEQGLLTIFDEVYRSGKPYFANELPVKFARKDGTRTFTQESDAPEIDTLYFNVSFKPLLNERGEIEGIIDIAADVTGQILARKKIEESEMLFRTLAETLPQLVWMTDEKGEQLFVSGRWEAYTGLVPKNEETWLKIIHPRDTRLIQQVWKTSLASGSQYKAEVRLADKYGEYRWHQVQGEPIYDEQGNIIRWIGAFTDIHDQKTFSARLEKMIFDRTAELQRSNEELEQFAHVASHDMREPLRKIRTFTDRLKTEFKDALPEKGKQFLDKMDKAAVRMNNMIEGVLKYSSLQDTPQKKETVDLNQILKDIQTDLELLIAQKKATLIVGDLPSITGDYLRLHQLFYNLISNSLKFSKPDTPPIIRINGTFFPEGVAPFENLNPGSLFPEVIPAKPPHLTIRIEDNGIGFPNTSADKIFKAFMRLHSRDRFEGTGLGLALCKRIVEDHGGTIRAEGKDNVGAVFIIELPLAPSPAPEFQ